MNTGGEELPAPSDNSQTLKQEGEFSMDATEEEERKKELNEINNFFMEYKRNLAMKIVAAFGVVFLLILEVVFEKLLIDQLEKNMIVSIQSLLGLNSKPYPEYMHFLAQIADPFWAFLFLTHCMLTIYYGIDAIFGTKIILTCLVSFSASKILNLFYQEPRPYWSQPSPSQDPSKPPTSIIGYGCNSTFANPDLGLITLLFFFLYTQYCFSRRFYQRQSSFLRRYLFSAIGILIVTVLSIMKMIQGQLYLTQIIIYVIYANVLLYLASYFDETIDRIIERTTFRATIDNRYILNYFLFILLILVLEIMPFIRDNQESSSYENMQYLHKYVYFYLLTCQIKCIESFNSSSQSDLLYLNQSIGWYPTFNQGTYLVAILASILAISRSFRKIQRESFWFKAPASERTQRVILVNIWVGFGWLAAIVRQRYQRQLDQIGIRPFYANSVIVFVLYYVPLGVMPILLFTRLHRGERDFEDEDQLKRNESNASKSELKEKTGDNSKSLMLQDKDFLQKRHKNIQSDGFTDQSSLNNSISNQINLENDLLISQKAFKQNTQKFILNFLTFIQQIADPYWRIFWSKVIIPEKATKKEMKSLFGSWFGMNNSKGPKTEQNLRIFIEESSYKSVKREVEVDCEQICFKFKHGIPRKSENSEFRIILVIKDRKDQSKIICKRILNNFERIFDGDFTIPQANTKHQYFMVDVQEYLLRQQYLPLQIKSADSSQMNIKVETEGTLEMRDLEKTGFLKQRFILTPEVLIYHSPNDSEKLYQILLHYINDIYTLQEDSKHSHLSFCLKTTNKAYVIKCKSNLDRNVWIKSLIHFTNLAKERISLQDINRKIMQIKGYQFELETRNSIFDKSVVFQNKKKMDNSLDLLVKHHSKFFEQHPNSKEIALFLKVVGVLINEINDLKTEGEEQGAKNKVNELYKYIEEQQGRVEELSQLGWNNLSLRSLENDGLDLEDKFESIFKFAEDLFNFLQRLSVSKNILLEEYYKQAEKRDLKALNDFII